MNDEADLAKQNMKINMNIRHEVNSDDDMANPSPGKNENDYLSGMKDLNLTSKKKHISMMVH